MLKRTKGYLLLILLVLTGLAGRETSNTLSGKERRFLVQHLKQTKTDLVQAVKGLSEEQMNFSPSPEKWSIKQCVQHLALSENTLWNMAEKFIKDPINPEKRKEIKVNDDGLISMISARDNKVKTTEALKPEAAKWSTASEALEAFKEKRNSLIKYAKTTTEDLRNHVGETLLGPIDSYQTLLLISAHTKRHTQQIEEIKADPAFPK